MKRITLLLAWFLILPCVVYCGQVNRIELTDGSVINGEIMSFSNGVYTINSPSVGKIQLKESQIYRIQPGSPSQVAPAPDFPLAQGNPFGSARSGYGQAVVNDPQNTAIMMGLASDPRIQDLTQDPDIAAAAKSGDIQALMKNKKFMDLVNNPEIQKTLDRIKQ